MYSLIQANIHPALSCYFVRVLGHGYLYEETSERIYSWPFMIFEEVKDSVSLAHVIEGGGLSLRDKEDIDGEYGMVNWGRLTDCVAEILKGKLIKPCLFEPI
jgi:hypothetical protein